MKKTVEQRILLELMTRRNSVLKHKVQLMDKSIYLLHNVQNTPPFSNEYKEALHEYYISQKEIEELDREYSIWSKAVVVIEDIINEFENSETTN